MEGHGGEEGWALAEHGAIGKAGASSPAVIAIADGFGDAQFKDEFDAVSRASTPTLDSLYSDHSRTTTLAAHGPAVGLPSDKDMGNSEVGHNALGSGKVINQGAALVDKVNKLFTFPFLHFVKLSHTYTQGCFIMCGSPGDGRWHDLVC